MAANRAVWGIEIGQCALKAIKLREAEGGQVELVAFDLIEHPKILSQPDAEPEELVRAAMEKFASRNEWSGDKFVIGVPGQQTFSRFTKLPPVEEKKIASIVQYEAAQQIPFDMDDVVWDYEVFRTEGSPDIEVGIFAMRKDLVRKQIDYFTKHRINPTIIQTVPSALYNFCRFDEQGGKNETDATVLVDVGAQKTDLIIVEPNSAWSRNIPLGGNNFTEALVKAFKLSFAKAESLKRTAASSKYARQIFQAMRPVFADLVAEIQRSLGFYASTHREVKLSHVLACGNAFRLQGLKPYLENNLSLPGGVIKLEKFNRVVPSPTLNAPQLTENLLGFGPAYGLALQGLELTQIKSNLLPTDLARVALWKQKTPVFVATAASLLVASILPWSRHTLDSAALATSSDAGDQARTIINQHEQLRSRFQEAQTDTSGKQASVDKLFELQDKKALVPLVFATVHQAIPPLPPELAGIDSPAELRAKIESNRVKFDRTQRGQVFIDSLQVRYAPNIDAEARQAGPGISVGGSSGGGSTGFSSGFGDPGGLVTGSGLRGGSGGFTPPPTEDAGGAGEPGFYVHVTGRLLYGRQQSEAVQFISSQFYARLREALRKPGLGFFLPEQDARNVPSLENLAFPMVQQYIAVQQTPTYGSGGGRSGRGGSIDVGGGLPAGAAEELNPNLDPVTGEDMTTDWRFDFGFKLKLGEMPADPNQPAEQTPTP